MRHAMFVVLFGLVTTGFGSRAFATPFDPGVIPDQIQAVGHLDVDALRKTEIFAAAGGQAHVDKALDHAPAPLQPLARALVRTVRGVSFWRDSDHGAIYLQTRDSRGLSQLVSKLPVKPAASVDGYATYTMSDPTGKGNHSGFVAALGDTLVLADSDDSLARSIHVLAGKAASLAGSTKLPLTSRQGVFVFVTIGDELLNMIQKHAHSKMLQLSPRSVAVDVGEIAGALTATARAEMRTADAVQKAKSILDGLQALATLSDDPMARTLLDGVTVTTNGLSVEVVAKLPLAVVTKIIQNHAK